MSNFADILSKKVDQIEKPKPLPVGTYLCLIDGAGEYVKLGANQTDAIKIKVKVLQAGEDVDDEALIEAGGVSEKTLFVTLFLTEDAAWRSKKFLVETLGIDGDGKSLGELFTEIPGKTFRGVIGHRPSKDGTEIYAEIKEMIPA